ncbi:MAG: hypothetical protein ABI605_11855 [Rhizobacter sp.]
MTRFNPKAIAIALLLSLALDVIGFVLLSHAQLADGLSAEQTDAALRALLQDTNFLLINLLYGTFTTVIGGYLAARIAGRYPYFNALAVGGAGIVLGLLLGSDAPAWFDAIAYATTLPAAVLGGHLGRRRNQ